MQSAAKERVLLVDDEPQVLVALEDLLSEDFVVLKTPSPEEAVEIAEHDQSIAVVISDQRMPNMNGDELLARVGASSDAQRILVTGFADLSAVIRAVNNGKIFAYVTKPWNPDDLVSKVRTAAEHFRLAQQLASERKLLDSVLNSLHEGIIAADPSGRCLLFNAQAESILGGPARDIVPERWAEEYRVFEASRREYLPAQDNPLLRAMAGEQVHEIETFVRVDSGPGKIVSIAGTPLTRNSGAPSGGVAVLRDVTRQRELEGQLVQAQKMDAMGRLAGGVAHDFNNLLVVIQSYAELLRETSTIDPAARADLDEILAAARRAGGLTRQLLAFSRSEAVQPTVLRLNPVVAGIEKMLRRIIGEDVTLFTELASDTGSVLADAGQLDQVILNLSVNARDAMPDGGQLTISTANVTLDAAYADTHANVEPGDFVMLAVTDTGTGMDRETQRRIFEPFFTTKEIGKGTGLGLATVYGIVQQSRGQIRVYSEPGRGTTFKVYLPRWQASSATTPTTRPDGAPTTAASGTILVVEDDSAVRQVAVRILREHGYAVLEASRPSEALTLCADPALQVDLLLTDVIMPDCTGPQLVANLAQRFPELRVVYMSGYPGGAAIRAGSLAEGAAYIEKPFTPSALADKIRIALEREP